MFIAVNYHYIDSEQKYERGIYPISPDRFKNQLIELGKRYTFIGQNELLGAFSGHVPLPEKSCLITFDDGLKTQYEHGVEILCALRVPAVFFINTLPHEDSKACQVHKIHYILSILPPAELFKKIKILHRHILGAELNQRNIEQHIAQKENRYDATETAMVKYLLNSYFEPTMASALVSRIFEEYCDDEEAFCRNTYLSREDIQEISNNELFSIGLHTKSHIDIPRFEKDVIVRDIRNNYRYLTEELGISGIKGIAYPRGIIHTRDIPDKIAGIARELGLAYGFTGAQEANERFDNPLLLARYDTNDVVGGKNPIQ